jgi:SSS family solute:Na+ symporter
VAAPLLITLAVALAVQRHMRGVSDFMTGGRVAGRYLVAVSDNLAGMGLITAVALFEFYYQSGFAVGHWGQIATPVTLMVTLSGFVIYRFRQTRAMTLAQFFEQRYSRGFRIFAGVMAALAGIVNYGLFPAVAGRFFVHYCGLPDAFALLGITWSTYALSMAIFLTVATVVVLFGGQLTVMVTDCVQGIISYWLYLVVAVAVLTIFNWSQMSKALLERPPGQSMLNPFDALGLQDFNIWYVLISVVGGVYMTMAWQGNQGYNCAAASPHEARMGKVLGAWRGGAMGVMFILLAVAAYTYLHSPDFAAEAQTVASSLQRLDGEVLQTQMRVPVAIAHFLPPGASGAFLAIMLMLMLSTDTTYLHSWGSIVIQDIVLPLRGKPFSPRGQLLLLRVAIVGVAVFAFFFSLYFNQTTYILMFFALTGAIYLGGAGACIIGGLYWSRGTTAGAWAAMICGATIATAGFVCEQAWPKLFDTAFPINGQWVWCIAMTSSIAVYVAVSLLTCRTLFNMDRLLHRGKYAAPLSNPQAQGLSPGSPPPPPPETPPSPEWPPESTSEVPASASPSVWRTLIGIGPEGSPGDRALAIAVFAWSMAFFALWLIVTLWNLVQPWSNETWAHYFWIMGVLFTLVVGAITGVWFTWGGLRDLNRLFQALAHLRRSELDDGRVIDHLNADELPPAPAPGSSSIPSPGNPQAEGFSPGCFPALIATASDRQPSEDLPCEPAPPLRCT